MTDEERDERRRHTEDFRTKPPSSPGSVLILTVSVVLLVTAAATALLGGGYSEATPHGRLLGTLDAVAEAQKVYHHQTGTFAAWERTLQLDVPDPVELRIVHATDARWEAVAEDAEVGLSCVLRGAWRGDRHEREPPACYR